MSDLIFLIPGLPLLGFVLLLVGGRKLGEPMAGWLATGMLGGSFLVSVAVFFGLLDREEFQRAYEQTLFEWVPAGELQVNFGFLADPLSITMCLFITGVGTLIHLYSIGYMHGDVNYSKFFLYLQLFAFSMLMLVLGDNLLITFLGWEGVGACSYFLISFWFGEESNATAGKKAFVTNRVGDFGFMLAMFLLFLTVGSLKFSDIFLSLGDMQIAESTATAIVVLLFVGAAGKSAQFPLYLWLPDAMAGPTPVSALIHAATMVTSGVYLLTRMNPVIAESAGWATDMIWIVGLFTALFAAVIAVGQNDIKKVLAYSTVSQLGFMFVAIGSGVYVAAIFHMITHAFFKALLFLGSGSVIHGMDDDQDMRNYGGLRKLMPITAGTFIIGWLAIAGVPPFAGFWSKDEILLAIYDENKVAWVLLLIAAILTAFYMSRLVFMTFFGDARWTSEEHAHDEAVEESAEVPVAADLDGDGQIEEGAEALVAAAVGGASTATRPKPPPHPHQSPWTMTLPLVALSGLAMVAGVLNLPFSSDTKFLEHWLEPVLFGNEHHIEVAGSTKWILAIIAIAAGAVGIIAAAALFLRRVPADNLDEGPLPNALYYDKAVSGFMGGPGRKFFDLVTAFDRQVIDRVVNTTGATVRLVGGSLRRFQPGLIRSYALNLAIGVVIVLVYFAARINF